MSDTQEKLLETSFDVAQNFEDILHRMFALREMIPALAADNYMDDAQTAMHSGIGGLMDSVYYDMKAMPEAYWTMALSHRNALIERDKTVAPFRLPEQKETDKATGTNG